MTKGTKNDLAIIQRVQQVRSCNNKLWVDIVRTALTVAPTKTRKLLAQITENDHQVTILMHQLSTGGKK
jgi:hypothetical protein